MYADEDGRQRCSLDPVSGERRVLAPLQEGLKVQKIDRVTLRVRQTSRVDIQLANREVK